MALQNFYVADLGFYLEIVYKAEMYFRLAQVEGCITSFANGPCKIKKSYFGFKSHAQPRADVSIILVEAAAGIFSPAAIGKCIKVRILAYQVAVL